MLILSRRCGQSVMIGDDVEVFVVGIAGGKVRLGIAGPARIPVHQRERCDARVHERSPQVVVAAEGLRSDSDDVD